MKYIIQTEIAPSAGYELENNPRVIEDLMAKWQAHNPIGQYFSLTRRTITVIVESDDEGAFFEALRATWRAAKNYPDVYPVSDIAEFPGVLHRAALG